MNLFDDDIDLRNDVNSALFCMLPKKCMEAYLGRNRDYYLLKF